MEASPVRTRSPGIHGGGRGIMSKAKIKWSKVWEKADRSFGGPIVFNILDSGWKDLIEKLVREVG